MIKHDDSHWAQLAKAALRDEMTVQQGFSPLKRCAVVVLTAGLPHLDLLPGEFAPHTPTSPGPTQPRPGITVSRMAAGRLRPVAAGAETHQL